MDGKKFARRCAGFLVIMGLLVGFLCAALYNAQVVHGSEYTAQSQRRIPQEEVVEVARGEILDRYGRVLVSNQLAYQVTLSVGDMGTPEERNAILSRLVTIALQEGLSWNDSLGISTSYPYHYTVEEPFYYTAQNEEGESYIALTRLGKLAVKMKWLEEDPSKEGKIPIPTAQELLEAMAETFAIETYDLTLLRSLCGILYETSLRSQDIYWVPYIFMEQVDIGFTVQAKEFDLAGVTVKPYTLRQYSTDYAAHLLGRVGLMNEKEQEYFLALEAGYEADDTVGKEGAEQAFEAELRGQTGLRVTEQNLNGDIMSSHWEIEPIPGNNVVLTLDIDLQKKVEDTLAERVPQMTEKGAACVLIDVKDGGVLAAGSYPTFQLATYGEDYGENALDPQQPLFNRALMGTYAPGSTFKMLVGIAGLEEGLEEPSSTILDTGRYTFYDPNNGPSCWIYNSRGGTHGHQNISDAIKNSCNIYFYDVGRRLGIARITDYASKFGLGVPTGVELAENSGVMAGPEYTESIGGTWYDGSTLSVSIGQENSQFTPLQLANYIATLVNGGTNYSAHFLKETKSFDYSAVVQTYQPEVRWDLNLEAENLEAVKQGMADLTRSGSVSADFQVLRTMGINVGAKTGTAQLTSVASGASNAVFVCFAPLEDPEVALAIVVENGGSGGSNASMAAEILEYYFINKSNRDEIPGEYTLIP